MGLDPRGTLNASKGVEFSNPSDERRATSPVTKPHLLGFDSLLPPRPPSLPLRPWRTPKNSPAGPSRWPRADEPGTFRGGPRLLHALDVLIHGRAEDVQREAEGAPLLNAAHRARRPLSRVRRI